LQGNLIAFLKEKNEDENEQLFYWGGVRVILELF
jgi:hypothetical protein